MLALAEAIRSRRGPTLLLGATPELIALAPPGLTVVDKSRDMIDAVWPGDAGDRSAIVSDWLELELAPGSLHTAIGDGSLNAIDSASSRALVAKLARSLDRDGRLACRFYLRPDRDERVDELFEAAERGAIGSFHAFKLRLAMAIAASRSSSNVAVAEVLAEVVARAPDRDELARKTGWSRAAIDTIDLYDGSRDVYWFPARDELTRAIPRGFAPPNLLSSGRYELAERCPILVLDRAP